jgi:hypothetical protein
LIISHGSDGFPRFVLASTQELHEKISELQTRVRELEDALRVSHSHLSADSHPLLADELLKIKAPLQREPPASRSPLNGTHQEEEHNPDVVDAFGSLNINSGRAKYFGQIANSWVSWPTSFTVVDFWLIAVIVFLTGLSYKSGGTKHALTGLF